MIREEVFVSVHHLLTADYEIRKLVKDELRRMLMLMLILILMLHSRNESVAVYHSPEHNATIRLWTRTQEFH